MRNTWTSVDPGLRLRLRPDAPAGYFVAFPLGRAMDGVMAVGEVVESRADGFAPGDIVSHAQGWREYAVVDPTAEQLGGVGTLTRLDVSRAEAQWYLGPLGGMGLTAYAGLHVIDALRGGETVWVSAAAGAVGSLAVQIAKLSGNRVIASAGSDEKVTWLRETLGVDAFNYRDGDLGAQLRALAPEGIDAYFDSVGGDHLEAALRPPQPQRASRDVRVDLGVRVRAEGSAQPVPRGVEGPHGARLPGQQQPAPDDRDAGADGRRGCATGSSCIARRCSKVSSRPPRHWRR